MLQVHLMSVSGDSCSNLQVRDAVAFPQGDLEDLQVGDEGSQPGQTLLAAAAHSDQQHVAPRRLQDSVNPAASNGRERQKVAVFTFRSSLTALNF